MEYYVIVFHSRSQTFEFYTLLSSYFLYAQVVNTPRQILSSCSVCVKTNFDGLKQAQSILARRRFDSFHGIYYVLQRGFQQIVKPMRCL